MAKNSGARVDSGKLAAFLGKVFLGGLLEECVICAEDFLYVRAVDLTNSVFIYCAEREVDIQLPPKVDKIGIGNLAMLYKLLEMSKDESVMLSYNGNRLDIDRGEHGVFNYLLSDPSVIPTVVEQEDAIQKLEALCTSYTDIKQDFQKDFLAYMAVSSSKIIALEVDGNELILVGGTATEHQFRVKAGNINPLKGKSVVGPDFTLAVYGDHLKAILQALSFSAEQQQPAGGEIVFNLDKAEFWYAEGKPLLIRCGDDNVWALLPVELSKGE